MRDAASEQRTALLWRHPDPYGLWSVALTGRLWERRRSHADFAEVRVSLCEQRLALTIKPCTTTLKVTVGYSTFLKIDGHAVALDTVMGLTDGTPPGVVKYKVRLAGQALVAGTA